MNTVEISHKIWDRSADSKLHRKLGASTTRQAAARADRQPGEDQLVAESHWNWRSVGIWRCLHLLGLHLLQP